jgi:hypothetical protein
VESCIDTIYRDYVLWREQWIRLFAVGYATQKPYLLHGKLGDLGWRPLGLPCLVAGDRTIVATWLLNGIAKPR